MREFNLCAISFYKFQKLFPVFVAKFDLISQTSEDLSFKKGDLMYVIKKDGDWWFACMQRSAMDGFIPSNFVAEFHKK